MPLTPPTASNDYQVTAAHTLNHELWNAVLASLQTRLNAAETALADYESAVSTEALAIAQGAVDDTIGPQIAALQDTITALQAAIATAEDQLAALQAGGVPAASVPVSEYSIIGAGNNVDEAFAIVVDALAAEVTNRTNADTALSNAIPALASQAEAEAGTNNTKFLTPLRGAQAIAAQVAPAGLVPIGPMETVSGTPVAVDIALPGGYEEYVIKIWGLIPASDGASIWLRTSTDGGSNFDSAASNYMWVYEYRDGYGTAAPQNLSDTKIIMVESVGSNSNEYGIFGEIRIFRPSNAEYIMLDWRFVYNDSTNNAVRMIRGAGRRLAASDVDAIRLLPSATTFENGGEYQLYGVVTS